jgi:hypothetical protein
MSITGKFREKDRNRWSFGLFRFEPIQKFMSESVSISISKSVSTSTPMSIAFHFGLFRNADFLFRFIPKRFRNTETNRKIIFLFHEKDRNRSRLGLFRFEPKQKLFVSRTPYNKDISWTIFFQVFLYRNLLKYCLKPIKKNILLTKRYQKFIEGKAWCHLHTMLSKGRYRTGNSKTMASNQWPNS